MHVDIHNSIDLFFFQISSLDSCQEQLTLTLAGNVPIEGNVAFDMCTVCPRSNAALPSHSNISISRGLQAMSFCHTYSLGLDAI